MQPKLPGSGGNCTQQPLDHFSYPAQIHRTLHCIRMWRNTANLNMYALKSGNTADAWINQNILWFDKWDFAPFRLFVFFSPFRSCLYCNNICHSIPASEAIAQEERLFHKRLLKFILNLLQAEVLALKRRYFSIKPYIFHFAFSTIFAFHVQIVPITVKVYI